MATEIIPELIEEAAFHFKNHLNLDSNERILFSGKFGKGKTTFLTEFFNQQEQYAGGELYDTIFLDPVNYTVSSNEDIFKYIKYDILLHLLMQRKVELENIQFTFQEAAQYYLASHPFKAIGGLLSYIPKIGMLIDEVKPGLEKLHEKILALKKDTEAVTEDNKASNFLQLLQEQPYSIYENDVITELIRKLLLQNNGKQNVLVIDNLDRIDPEHIFRILNIFSVQMDYSLWQTKMDKFNFDKVIVVCDIHNVRNIYANRYGTNVDFSGYIDKFYSSEIFYFQNYEPLRKAHHNILRQLSFIDEQENKKGLNQLGTDFGLFYLVTAMIMQNLVSLRQMLNFCASERDLPELIVVSKKGNGERQLYNTPLLEMMVLAKLVGGYHELTKAIEILASNNTQISNHEQHFKLLVNFELWNNFSETSNGEYTWRFDGHEFRININEDWDDFAGMTIRRFEKINSSFPEYTPSYAVYYKLYNKILHEFNLLKYVE